MESKACSKCKVMKGASEFYRVKRRSMGLHIWCKLCIKEYNSSTSRKVVLAKYAVSPARKASAAKSHASLKGKARRKKYNARHDEYFKTWRRMYQYGLSEAEYVALWERQDGRCANQSCLVAIVMNTRKCNVDHCHESGKVRGLLCPRCNVSLGYLEDRKRMVGLELYLSQYLIEKGVN